MLNESQMRAVKHVDGAMMVLAGPGSGKTTVITQRTLELIEQQGVKPENILVITFTRAAAAEMKDRFIRLYHGRDAGVNFGTFHAVFFKIIKYAYRLNSSNIIGEDEKYKVLREATYKLGLEIDDEKDFLESISNEISKLKNEEIALEHYYSINCPEADFKRLYMEYDNYLKQNGKMDFDDIMLICWQLLNGRSDILSFWQDRYKYILIDEFQDINMLQYKIIRLLAKPQNNLFIVGDDDQSVYSFRGARPEIMLNFEKDFEDCKRVVLDVNYRCTPQIMKSALALIGYNKTRYEKKLVAASESGAPVVFRDFPELRNQNEYVKDMIIKSRAEGLSFKDNAVLYRTNSQPRALLELLSEYNIPYKTKERVPNIYDHWITKNILAYMEMAVGDMSRGLFLQICNRPKRYITRDSISDSVIDLGKMKSFYRDKSYVVEKLDKLEYDLKIISKLNPFAAINYIRKAVGYDDYLKEYAQFRKINEDELFEAIEELQEAAGGFKSFLEWKCYIEEYTAECRERDKERRDSKNKGEEEDAVVMMTFHSAKGLEFKNVYIVDACEGLAPHKKALLEADIEEERRMFYVAATRAKKELHVISTETRYGKKLEPSRFIGEMKLGMNDLSEGMIVVHEVYGRGIVKNLKQGKITIAFDEVMLPKILDLDTCVKRQLLRRE